MTKSSRKGSVIIVGAGSFGAVTALELQNRGFQVSLFDPGPLPHPDASSTDISKILRSGYGSDEFYTEMMEDAFVIWDRWNQEWERPLFHQTGVLMMSTFPEGNAGFEANSYEILLKRGHPVERVDSKGLEERFPAWNADRYPSGYLNPNAGWAESAEVVKSLIKQGEQAGVELYEGKSLDHLLESGSRVSGIRTTDGIEYQADHVVIAAGAWTPYLHPHLDEYMWVVGQPVIHFKPENPLKFQPPQFPVFAADISNTGWYGFPVNRDGILKVANHGVGWRVDPRQPRVLPESEESRFREFFAETFPELEQAPKVSDRMCLYCDTWDGDFWIDEDPLREGLIICTGGSGHGFKFVPLIGQITADVIEKKPNKYKGRFAWRTPTVRKTEDARFLD